jgi:hypothetical protein
MVGISSLEELGTNAVEYAVGFGLGVALGRALGPLATSLEQEAYAADPSKAIDPHDAARIVAQALEQLGWGQSEAAASGLAADKFALLEQAELHAPTVGELLQLIRRAQVTDAEIAHALRKAQLEPTWDARIQALAQVALTPAEVATAVHRNIMVGPGLIVKTAPTTPGRVEQVPQSQIDPVEQASWYGTSAEQLRVLVGITGLPPSLGEMLQLLNRGEVTEDDVRRAVAQSNIRNEYMDVVLGLRRRLLTPHEYQEAALRGVIPNAAADAGSALAGMEAADAQLLFEILGRPLAVHQITTGLARGGSYGGGYTDIPEPYRDAVRRSNIRPEYAVLAHANRYTIPSYFILRAILQDGGMTEAEFGDYGKQLGWPPDLAEKAAKAIGGAALKVADPHVTKAATQLWTTLHTSYVDGRTVDADASADLAAIGVAAAGVPQVLELWARERAIVRRSLTVKQIHDAIGQPGKDAAWAAGRLAELGYSADDAQTILAD